MKLRVKERARARERSAAPMDSFTALEQEHEEVRRLDEQVVALEARLEFAADLLMVTDEMVARARDEYAQWAEPQDAMEMALLAALSPARQVIRGHSTGEA